MRVLVIGGATGKVGSSLLTQLLSLPTPPTIRISTRHATRPPHLPPHVEHAVADLAQPSTFAALLRGVDGVFVYVARGGEYGELCAEAVRGGVQRLVLLSSYTVAAHPDGAIGAAHARVEAAVRASGVAYTFVRAGYFAHNTHQYVDPQLRHGVVELPYPDARLAPVAQDDLAAVALVALTTGALVNEAPLVTGPASMALSECVTAISEVRRANGAGTLSVRQVGGEEWVERWGQYVPGGMGKVIVAVWAGLDGKPAQVMSSERITGKPATTFEQWVVNRKEDWMQAA